MIPEPRWLTERSVDAMHAALIDEHGGLHGVRDRALIESALARPQNRYAYSAEACDLPELAAAYGFGLVKNHGYLDGNKRVGLACLLVFLRANGLRLRVTEAEAVVTIERLAAGGVSEEDLAEWIRERAQPVDAIRPV
jgi:death-on-curing protein